jgi:hypothetical protein
MVAIGSDPYRKKRAHTVNATETEELCKVHQTDDCKAKRNEKAQFT